MTIERKQEIFSITKELQRTFQNHQIDNKLLENCFNDGKYAHIISIMRKHMSIFCKLSVKYISRELSSEEINKIIAPAYVDLPEYFPPYGSQQNNLKIQLTFYKDLMGTYFRFVTMMAHELSHVLLHSINHPLKQSEEATDITALIFGFGRCYELGHTIYSEGNSYCKLKHYSVISSLSFEEVIYALSLIEKD